MSSPIAIETAYKPIEVDLWGASFETVDPPRSGARRVTEIMRQLADLDKAENAEEDADELNDKAVGLIAELLDVRLRNANGSRTKASTHIKRKWEADELSVAKLFAFLERLGEADQARPT